MAKQNRNPLGVARTSSNSGLFLGVACQQRLMRSAMSWSTRLSWSFGRSFEVTLCGTSVCEMPAACLRRHREVSGMLWKWLLRKAIAQICKTADISGGKFHGEKVLGETSDNS